MSEAPPPEHLEENQGPCARGQRDPERGGIRKVAGSNTSLNGGRSAQRSPAHDEAIDEALAPRARTTERGLHGETTRAGAPRIPDWQYQREIGVHSAIWGIWHLPAFFLSGTVYAEWNFLPFFVGNIVLAVLITPIFNNARGSLLWPMLLHWQLINPFWPDAQPWDTWIFLAVAAVVVWWNRDTMFTREGAVTEVVPLVARPPE